MRFGVAFSSCDYHADELVSTLAVVPAQAPWHAPSAYVPDPRRTSRPVVQPIHYGPARLSPSRSSRGPRECRRSVTGRQRQPGQALSHRLFSNRGQHRRSVRGKPENLAFASTVSVGSGTLSGGPVTAPRI